MGRVVSLILSIELRCGDLVSSKGIGAGIGEGEIHFRRLGRTKIPVGATVLHLVEGIPEHLVVSLLPVEQEVDGFTDLLVVDLAVQVFIDHLGPLLRSDVAEQVRTQIAVTVT